MVKARAKLLAGLIGIVGLAAILELLILPTFYAGIPLPLPETRKPVGGALFGATFFHLLILSAVIFGSAVLLKRFGVKVPLAPESRGDWLNVLMLFVFLGSGLGLWYSPAFLPALIISGLYLLMAELR